MAFLDENGLAELWSLICNKHNGFVNEYVWEKSSERQVEAIIAIASGTRNFNYSNSQTPMYRTASLVNGTVVLSDPFNATVGLAMIGYYAYDTEGDLCKVIGWISATTNACTCDVEVLGAGTETIRTFEGYVNSTDPNAYPIDDGYTYTALGQIGNKVQIATGRYTGTGTCGASNPNSLTFDFVPKLVIVTTKNVGLDDLIPIVYINGATGLSGDQHYMFDLNGTTLSWYVSTTSGSGFQFNYTGKTYLYTAIG